MTSTADEVISINKGEDKTFLLYILGSNDRPFDLTDYDKFKVCLPKQDGSTMVLTEVANVNGSKVDKTTDDILGVLEVTLDRVDSALLFEGSGQTICVEIENSVAVLRKRKSLDKILDVSGNCF